MLPLKDKTFFITGASRGIGKAIALRAAEDGANIAIIAKTDEPHPKLEGTIYKTAEEVEKRGGKALPLKVDIRNGELVQKAVKRTAKEFGGIDILINNASAIQLSSTEKLPLKKYELMMDVNANGTYICSKLCYPYLKEAENAHILTLSPPINLKPKWLGAHPAYTLSKYGMSMLTLGFAEEWKAEGIKANTLWPATTIATAAVEVHFSPVYEISRKPEIMSDAAYEILTKENPETGKHFIDEDILKDSGIKDLSGYNLSDQEPPKDIFLD